MRKKITVVEYDPTWPATFETLATPVRRALGSLAVGIEHVGSTAVPGLCAKPVIDMSVVVGSAADLPGAITRLTSLGYVHRGDLGVQGREAFAPPPGLATHHLYVCPRGSLGLRNHLAVRDALRSDPELAAVYGALKRDLAERHPRDVDRYVDGKTAFLLEILRASDLEPDELSRIEAANRP